MNKVFVVLCTEGILQLRKTSKTSKGLLALDVTGTLFDTREKALRAIYRTKKSSGKENDNSIFALWKAFEEFENVRIVQLDSFDNTEGE